MVSDHPGARRVDRIAGISDGEFLKARQDAFRNPEFVTFLERRGIQRLVFTGLAAEHCVHAAVRSALTQRGLRHRYPGWRGIPNSFPERHNTGGTLGLTVQTAAQIIR